MWTQVVVLHGAISFSSMVCDLGTVGTTPLSDPRYIHTWVQTIFISVNYFLCFWIWTKKLRVFVSQEQKMINSIVATFVLCMFLVWSETQGLQYLFHLPFEHQAGNVTSGRLLSKLNFKQVCWGSGNMSNISSFMNMFWKFNIILLKAW